MNENVNATLFGPNNRYKEDVSSFIDLMYTLWWILTWIFSKTVLVAYRWFFVEPLRRLYFRGPYLMGYGFWAGKSDQEICTRAHDVMQEVWDRQDLCQKAVEAKFESFLVGCEVLLYLFFLFAILSFVWNLVKTKYTGHETERVMISVAEAFVDAMDRRSLKRRNHHHLSSSFSSDDENNYKYMDVPDIHHSPIHRKHRKLDNQ